MDKRAQRLFAGLSLAVLAVTVAAIVDAARPPWKSYQRAFYRLAASYEQDQARRQRLLRTPLEIRQILLPGLNRVDRCPTCHLGVEDPDLAAAPHPFRYHRGLEPHRVERFGCTVCHGGQGLATEKTAAHGPVPNWLEPRLPRRYRRASCARCHSEGEIPGVPELGRAREIFATRGCPGCHRLNGFGNTIGPDLSDEARRGRTPDWLEQHFRDPRSLAPTSPMPDFRFARDEIEALTLWVLSLTTEPMAPYYRSVPVIPSAAEGRRLLVRAGCLDCHAIGGVGGRLACDLAGITKRRSARYIERQLEEPETAGARVIMPAINPSRAACRAIRAFLECATAPDARALIADGRQGAQGADRLAELGRRRTLQFGCVGCHGAELKGGVKNPNSQGGEVPALIHLAEDYTREEAATIIRRGKTPALEDPAKPAPPLYMPSWKKILTEEDIERILAYAWSLLPPESEAW